MRIKKVSQTTPTSSQVLDSYSTSASNSYSCNYINNNSIFIPGAIMELTDESTTQDIYAAFGGQNSFEKTLQKIKQLKPMFIQISDYIDDEPNFHVVPLEYTYTEETGIEHITLFWNSSTIQYFNFDIEYTGEQISAVSYSYDVETLVYDDEVLTLYNQNSYTPSNDYNPATKKYVDDIVGNIESILAEV